MIHLFIIHHNDADDDPYQRPDDDINAEYQNNRDKTVKVPPRGLFLCFRDTGKGKDIFYEIVQRLCEPLKQVLNYIARITNNKLGGNPADHQPHGELQGIIEHIIDCFQYFHSLIVGQTGPNEREACLSSLFSRRAVRPVQRLSEFLRSQQSPAAPVTEGQSSSIQRRS